MTHDPDNPLGGLRDLKMGAPPPVGAIARIATRRRRRRRAGGVAAFVAAASVTAVAFNATGDDTSAPDLATDPTITVEPTPETTIATTTSAAGADDQPSPATDAAETDRPPGDCAEPVLADDDDPATRVVELGERFMSDRLAGLAAELCLTPGALTDFERSEPTGDGIPALCLFTCPKWTLATSTAIQSVPGSATRFEVLVDYQAGESVQHLREVFDVVETVDGTLRISSARIEVESWITVSTARQVIGTLLDALAAGEWDAAVATLVNEGGTSDPRLGDDEWYREPYDDVFTAFCAQALCGAPYVLGESIAASQQSRTLLVTFASVDGPVDAGIRVSEFEGITTVDTLPPDGVPAGEVDSLHHRLFGADDGPAILGVRAGSVERATASTSQWSVIPWPRPTDARLEPANDRLVQVAHPSDVAAYLLGDPSSEAASLREPIGKPGERFAGAATIDGQGVVFALNDENELFVTDIDTLTTRSVDCPVCGTDDEDVVWSIDVAGDTMAIGHYFGDAFWTTFHRFDLETLTVESESGRIEDDENSGSASLAVDASTAAAAIFDRLNEPARSVAVFDVTTGNRLDTWVVPADATIEVVDYDGRYVLAELSDNTTWVIDTNDGGSDGRIVDTTARVRFG